MDAQLLSRLERLAAQRGERLEGLLERLEEELGARAGAPGARRGRGGRGGTLSPEDPDRYELHEVIGQGGMGTIRRVFDRRLQRFLVRKEMVADLSAHAVVRFLTEAQITAQLQHPGVVPVYDLGVLTDGTLFFTMQEVRGQTLRAAIQGLHRASRGGRWRRSADGWALRDLVHAFHRVCETVACAHQQGIVHRDLKPANVMLGPFGEVFVLDWGLASVVERPWPRDREAIVRDAPQGTPAYRAPEALPPVGLERTIDVYALGAMLFEILAGQPPSPLPQGERSVEAAAGSLSLPLELSLATRRALAQDPSERHPDAGSLAEDVSGWLAGRRARRRRVM